MAYVFLSGTQSGDLRTYAAYQFGMNADTVSVAAGYTGTIKTYEGGDGVVLRNLTNPNVINTVMLGSGGDALEGSGVSDHVHDGSGDDYIYLGGGHDKVFVGTGNDYYNGESGNDWISFEYASNDGLSALIANAVGVTLDLASIQEQNFGVFGFDKVLNFENAIGGNGIDVFYGTEQANNLTGRGGNDVFHGFGGNDFLIGETGNDSLYGDGGNDTIIGGIGNDTLVGNVGQDNLTGNAGADRIECGVFLWVPVDGNRDTVFYNAISDSGLDAATRDTVWNFDRNYGPADTGSDRFNFAAMDANAGVAGDQAFLWRGTGVFSTSAAGEIRIQDMGTDFMVWVDTDADTAAEMSILVKNVDVLTLADFML